MYAGSLGLDTILSLITLSLITRMVSIETFSIFALFQVAVSPLLPLIDLGCGTSIVRAIANEPDPAQRARIQATLLASRAIIAFAVAASIAVLLPWFLPSLTTAIRIFAATLFVWTFSLACGDALRAEERHGVGAAGIAARAIVRTAATILLVKAGWGLEGLLLALGASWAASILIYAGFLARALRAMPSMEIYRGFLRFGAPAAGYYLTRNLGHLDRHLVRSSGHLENAGIYQVASTPTQAIDMLEFGASLAIEPFLFAVRPQELPALLDRVLRWTATALLTASIGLGLLGPEILLVLAPSSYLPALGALPWLAFAGTSRALARLIGYGAAAGTETRAWLAAGVVETALAAAIILAVIGPFGPTGAAIGRFGAAAAAIIAAVSIVGKNAPLDAVVRVLVASVVSALAVASVASWTVAPIWARMLVGVALLGGTLVLIQPSRRRPGA